MINVNSIKCFKFLQNKTQFNLKDQLENCRFFNKTKG